MTEQNKKKTHGAASPRRAQLQQHIRAACNTFINLLFPPTKDEQIVAKALALSPHQSAMRVGKQWTIHALSDYNDHKVGAAIRTLKYAGSQHAAALLAHTLNDALLEETANAQLWHDTELALIPVPLFCTREHTRGFNQITRVLDELVHVSPSFTEHIHTTILTRTRDTVTQTKLSKKERAKNVRGAFAASLPQHKPTRYVVIDDVVTTGSTLTECARALSRAGVKTEDIILLALARA